MSKHYPEREYEGGGIEPGTSHAAIVERIAPNSTVLDAGCATGYIAAALGRSGCTTFGIELNPAAAEAAKKHCAAVAVVDLERVGIASAFQGRTFDYIIFGDVLEHLREPWNVLDASRSILSPNGRVIASIPNVAHGAVRLALLRGEFDYSALGILDNTHLRFFTVDSMDELLLRGGFTIETITRTRHPVFVDDAILVPAIRRKDVEPALAAQIEAAPEADTLQFIVTARPISDGERMTAALDRIARLRREAALLRRALGVEKEWEPPSDEAAGDLSALLRDEREQNRILRTQLARSRARIGQTEEIHSTAREAMEENRTRSEELEERYRKSLEELSAVRAALVRTESMVHEARRVADSREIETESLRREVSELRRSISEMQQSKFWKLREKWLAIRTQIGSKR